MRRRRFRAFNLFLRFTIVVALLFMGVGATTVAQAADPQSSLGITKTNDLDGKPLEPGGEFHYNLVIQCSGLTVDCVNYTVTDTLPAEFDVTSLPQSTTTRTVTYDAATRLLTIVFIDPLQVPAGALGLRAGATINLELGMRLPPDTTVAEGTVVTNTADAAADNADPKSSQNDVTVSVPRNVVPVATKKWDDGSAVAGTAEHSTITLGVRNGSSSSAEVTELSVADENPDTFEYFDLDAVAVQSFPVGADTALLRVKTATGWVDGAMINAAGALALPAGVDPASVTGVEVIFTNAAGEVLPYDATGGSVTVGMVLRDTARSNDEPFRPSDKVTVNNCATPSATDAVDGKTAGNPACAPYDILPDTLVLTGSKTFFPDTNGNFKQDGGEYAVVGENSGVSGSVSVKNNSPFPIQTVTITEPDPESATEFNKIDLSSVRVKYPVGAAEALVTVTYEDGSAVTLPGSNGQVLDITKSGQRVASVSVTYKGADADGNPSIAPGSSAALDFHGNLDDLVTDDDLPGGTSPGIGNCAGFAGSAGRPDGTGTAAGNACKTLSVVEPSTSTTGVKTVGQTSVPLGQPIPFSLKVLNNGNKPLVTPVVSDPRTGPDGLPDPNYPNPFDTLRLSSASVAKAGSVPGVAIEVLDSRSNTWVAYNASDAALLDSARGVRAVLDGNLAPTASFTLNLVTERRDGSPENVTLLNCFSTSAGGDYEPGDPACAPQIETGPADDAAAINKSITPSTLPEYVPGLPKQFTGVALSVSNTGNMSAKTLQLTDDDTDFFDAVDLASLKTVTFPAGSNRAQIDAYVDGAWVTGVPSASKTGSLPSGVSASDVRGLRVTFTSTQSANGGYAITPCAVDSCRGGLTFQVSPRQTLVSDPSTVVPAHLENTVTGSYLTQIQDPDAPQEVDPNTATLDLTEGSAKLAVEKTPNSVLEPGEKGPFYLKVTNTGTSNIADLLVKDLLPAGIGFDPSYVGDNGQPFKVINAQVPDGTPAVPHPTFTSVNDGEHVSELGFGFSNDADGNPWYFAPGATFTIQIQVSLEPGVLAGQVVTNTMGATSTSPSTDLACDGTSEADGSFGSGTYCTDPAQLTVKGGAAFQARKWVHGNDSLGWYNTLTSTPYPAGDAACPSATDANGLVYTAYPCIALVNPGDKYSYMLRLVNSGTEAGTDMRIIDRFPITGDKGVVVDQDRGTEWDQRPTLASEPKLTGEGTLSTTYTNSEPICTDDLKMGGNGSNAPTCDPSEWADPYSSDVAAANMQVSFDPALAPGGKIDITFEMDTPLDVTPKSDPTIAWNSYAHAETTDRNGSPNVLPPTEPIQVGVGLAYGNLSLTKTIGENPSNLPLDSVTFGYQVKCTIHPIGGADRVVLDQTYNVSANQSQTVAGIPAGADCQVWEVDSRGGISSNGPDNPISVAITAGTGQPSIQAVNIQNDFPDSIVELTKLVTGDGAKYAPGEYPVEVYCTFLGQPVDGYSPKQVILTPSEGQYATNVPAGSQCSAVETDDGGATVVTYDPAGSAGAAGSGEVTTESGSPEAITVTNEFHVAGLVVNKEVDGAGAPELAQGPFTFDVTCSFNGVQNMIANSITIPAGDGSQTAFTSEPVAGIPTGAVCVVIETDNGGADATPGPITVTIPDGSNVVAGFTGTDANQFSAGTIGLAKKLAGPAADEDYAKNATFTIDVTCERDATDAEGNPIRTTVFSSPVQITGGQTIDALTGADGQPVKLPVGSHCYAAETEAGGATSSAIDLDSFDNAAIVEVLDDPSVIQALAITATNTFDYGDVSLSKKVTGDAASYVGAREFTVAVTCTLAQGGTAPTVLFADKEYAITGGETITIDELPVGAHCWAVETDEGGATESTVSSDSADNAAVVAGDDPMMIEVTNRFDAGILSVTKKVVNGLPGPYSFTLGCLTDLGEIALSDSDASFSLKAGETKTISVPLGAQCVVSEVNVPGNATVAYVDSDGLHDGTVAVDGTASIEVTNTFKTVPIVDPGTGGQGTLSNTGAPLRPIGLLAIAALGIGVLLVRFGRRRA